MLPRHSISAGLLSALLLLIATPSHTAPTYAGPPPGLTKTLIAGQWKPPGGLRPTAGPAGLTAAPAENTASQEPWLRLVYNVYDPAGQDWDIERGIVVQQPQGGTAYSQIALTKNESDDIEPRLSPDGSEVLFTSDRSGNDEIYRMSADGGALAQLTGHPQPDGNAVWSPDGSRIAFASRRDGNWNIYVMGRDGGAPARLTSDPAPDVTPSWSPDGRSLAWMRAGANGGTIWLMNADGSGQQPITPQLRYLQNPVWSPDGELIAFDYDRDGDGLNRPAAVRPDGSELRELPLTNNGSWIDPSDIIVNGWSPDGDRVFGTVISYRSDGAALYAYASGNVRISLLDRSVARITSQFFEAFPDGVSMDRTPPVSVVEALPDLSRAGPITLRWSAADPGGAGVDGYDVEYQVDGGQWTRLARRQREATFSFSAGAAGTTVAFRVRARDFAGNLEAPRPNGDTRTTFYTVGLDGRLTDQRGYPASASLTIAPAGFSGTIAADATGAYSLLLTKTGAHTVAVSAPGFSAPPPTVLMMDRDRTFSAMLQPLDNLLSGGSFEAQGLGGWAAVGALPAKRITETTFTGGGAVQIGEPCADPCMALPTPPMPLDPSFRPARLVVDTTGREHIVEAASTGTEEPIIYRTRLGSGPFSTPEIIGQGWAANAAADSDGRLHAIWYDVSTTGIVHRVRDLDGSWSPKTRLPLLGDEPKIVAGVGGKALLVAPCVPRVECYLGNGFEARTYTPGAGWGPTRLLSVKNGTAVAGPDGRFYFARQNFLDGIYLGVLGPDDADVRERLIAPMDLNDSTLRPALAVDSRGAIHMVVTSDFNTMIHYVCTTGLECVAVRTLNIDAVPRLAIDRQDVLHLVDMARSLFQREVGYRRIFPDGRLTERALIDSDSNRAQIEIDPAGRVYVMTSQRLFRTPNGAPGVGGLAQAVTVPANLHRPTLSFAYSLSGTGPTSSSGMRLLVREGQGTPTEVFSTTTSSSWRAAWIDMAPWAGKTVTIVAELEQATGEQAAVLQLDDIALSSWQTPVVAAVQPRVVPATEGSTLTISGENFLGTPQVLLGDTKLQVVALASPQTLTAKVPAGLKPGMYQLRVINPGGQVAPGALVAVGRQTHLPLLKR